MVYTPRLGSISCLLKEKRIIITKAILCSLLELEECENPIFFHIAHPTFEDYNRRVIGKNFESSNAYLKLTYFIL